MNALEKVLNLRPGNVAARLGNRSRLPVLSPRDLLRGQAARPAPLLCVSPSIPEQAGGILRAARDRDAVIGLACVHDPARRDLATRFFEHVRKTTDEYGHRLPVFLQAGPLRITTSEERAVAELEGAVFRYVDAGFSMISLDASTLPAADGHKLYARLARAASERELAVEVVPAGATRPDATGLRTWIGGLARAGLRPDFVRLRSTHFLPESLDGSEVACDFQALEALRAVAEAGGVALSLEDRGTPLRTVPAWSSAKLAKVDASHGFARRVLQALGQEVAATLEAEAAQSGALLSTLLGERPMLTSALEETARDRIEALAYSETSELLRALGAVGSGSRIVAALSEGGE